MSAILKKVYIFLFRKHDIGFMRFCYIMLIPCALSKELLRWWMLFMSFVLVLVTHANYKGWNRSENE